MPFLPKNCVHHFILFIVLSLCATTWTIAQINWQQSNGPYGGEVKALTVSGANIFAGTHGGGVFLSTNNGTNWSTVNSGMTNQDVYALTVSGSNIVAGTDNGVYLSTNNGTSWSAVNSSLTNTTINTLNASGANIFAGTGGSGVFIGTPSASPRITSFAPTRNAINVAKDTTITVTFDIDINFSTVTNSTVRINGSLSGLHPSMFSYNQSAHTITVTPNSPFKVGELVTATLTRGIKSTNNDSLLNSFSWRFSVKPKKAAGLFTLVSTVNVGTHPGSAAVLDVDGNGILDLAVVNNTANTISILKNDGTGSFTQTSIVNSPQGTYAAVAAADFDGDGSTDLALVCYSSTVSILKNNGTGIFSQTSTITVGSNPNAIIAEDFDGDGSIDLAVSNNSSNNVSILKNNGNGTFTLSSTVGVGSYPTGLTSADVNNDGSMDIIVSNSQSGTVSILLNDGKGTFTLGSSPSVGNYPWNVIAADLDGDGFIDLAVPNYTAGTVTIMKNNGSGIFTKSATLTAGTNPNTMTAMDIDGDGNLDLLVTNTGSGTVSIFKNNGSGTFSLMTTVTGGSNPAEVKALDIDGNGYIDWVLTNSNSNTVSVFKNNPPNGVIRLSSSSLSFGTIAMGSSKSQCLKIFNDGTDSSLVIRNMNTSKSDFFVNRSSLTILPSGSDSVLITFAPKTIGTITDSLLISSNDIQNPLFKIGLSGIGSLGIVSVTPTRNALNVLQNTTVSITFNTNINSSTLTNNTVRINGSLSGLHTGTISFNAGTLTATLTPTTPFKLGELVTVMLAQGIKSVTGDSLANGYSWSFTVRTNACSGLFQQSSTVGVGIQPWYLAAADFDKDGAIDLAVVNNQGNSVSILKNDGSGSFTLASTLAVGNSPGSIIAADLDGDGYMDLAVTNSGSGTVSLLKNNGNGSFTRSDIQSNGTSPWNVAALDVDGDGDLDLAVANLSSNNVSIYKNDGKGAFVYFSSVSVGQVPYTLAILDLEGDGVMDLAVANYTSNSVSLLKNDGNGIFTQISTVSVGNGPVSVLPVNIDGDTTADFAVSNTKSSTISILKNNGSGGFSLIATDTLGTQLALPAATDIDGDGSMDLIVPGVERITVLKNNGTGMFGTKSVFNVSKGSTIRMVVAADFNNDGQVDFVGVDQNTNSIVVFKASLKIASLRVSSSALSFGTIAAGTSKSQYLKMYNDGTDSSLVISSIVTSNPVFTLNRTSLIIPALGSDSVQIVFRPTHSNLAFSDSLLLTTNDSSKSMVKILLSGASSYDQPKQVVVLASLGGPIYAGLSMLSNNIIYAVASGDAIYRMNTSGTIAYTLQVGGDVRSSISIAYDTTIYIASSDRNIYAFSKDGNSVWSLPTGGALTATPVVDSIANRLYIGVSNHNFIAVNRSTGKVDWNYFADDQIRSSAVVTSDRRLVFATQKGTLYGFNLKNLTLPAAPTWQIALPDTAPSSIALDNLGYIYIGTSTGRLLKITMPTNQQPSIVWQVGLGQAIVGSPVIDAAGTLYAGSLDTKLYAVDIQSGVVKWALSTKGAIRSTPAISDAGNIYVANDSGEVISLDTSKNIRWYYKTSNSIAAPLLYYQSTLYAGTLGNQVLALSDAVDSSRTSSLYKSDASHKGKPIWATFQGNNQRTGMFSSTVTGIKNSSSGLPNDYILMQNYPNPFNPSTTIQFALPKEGRVSIKIFNMLGKQIVTLMDGFQYAGYHEVTFSMDSFSSGIYFYQMQVENFLQTKKLLLLK